MSSSKNSPLSAAASSDKGKGKGKDKTRGKSRDRLEAKGESTGTNPFTKGDLSKDERLKSFRELENSTDGKTYAFVIFCFWGSRCSKRTRGCPNRHTPGSKDDRCFVVKTKDAVGSFSRWKDSNPEVCEKCIKPTDK